ncbi:TPA: hypothetical protein ACXYOX_004223 [Escherichia coli]
MFRANAEGQLRLEEATNYLFPIKGREERSKLGHFELMARMERMRHMVEVITSRLGPFVESYPEWHPFITFRGDGRCSETTPNLEFLDHSRFMVNGFITCPYHGGDQMIATVEGHGRTLRGLDGVHGTFGNWFRLVASMGDVHASYITEELIEQFENGDDLSSISKQNTLDDAEDLIQMYASNAQPILVWVAWDEYLQTEDHKIPAAAAVPLMLARNLADLPNAACSETWESMLYMLIGSPHGARSSMFLDQLTVKQMRTMFNALMATGAYDK